MVSVQSYMKNREELRNIGRKFPIGFDERNEEAIDYIDNIRVAIQELKEEKNISEQLIQEFAEGTIPYNDYKAANAFSQLGLYMDDEVYGDMVDLGDMLVMMRSILFNKSESVIISMIDNTELRND